MLSAIKPHLGVAQILFVVAALIFVVAAIVDCTIFKKVTIVAATLIGLAVMAVGLIYFA